MPGAAARRGKVGHELLGGQPHVVGQARAEEGLELHGEVVGPGHRQPGIDQAVEGDRELTALPVDPDVVAVADARNPGREPTPCAPGAPRKMRG